jgi:hypothetical protein
VVEDAQNGSDGSTNGDAPSDNEEDEDEDEEEGEDGSLPVDDKDDGIDEMADLSAIDQETLISDTKAVRGTVSKLRDLSFAIINSTTKALPAWKLSCRKLKKKALLIPRDVTTRWNSTYDTLEFCLRYRKPIDAITADKATKLRKYELDEGDWNIVDDLVVVLKVVLDLVVSSRADDVV